MALKLKTVEVTANVFANKADVVRYLKANGCQVSKTKVYDDIKKGILPSHEGVILEADVKAYAIGLKKTGDLDSNLDELAREEGRKKNIKLDLEIERRRFDLEKDRKLYILKSEYETDLSVRAGILQAGFKHLLQTGFRECVQIVSGDTQKTQQGIEYLSAAFDDLLDEYARMDAMEVVADV